MSAAERLSRILLIANVLLMLVAAAAYWHDRHTASDTKGWTAPSPPSQIDPWRPYRHALAPHA